MNFAMSLKIKLPEKLWKKSLAYQAAFFMDSANLTFKVFLQWHQ